MKILAHKITSHHFCRTARGDQNIIWLKFPCGQNEKKNKLS